MTIIALYRALGFAGAWVSSPEEGRHATATSSGQQLPKVCRPSSEPAHCPGKNPRLAPSFTSQAPHKGRDVTGYSAPPPTTRGPPIGGGWWWWWWWEGEEGEEGEKGEGHAAPGRPLDVTDHGVWALREWVVGTGRES